METPSEEERAPTVLSHARDHLYIKSNSMLGRIEDNEDSEVASLKRGAMGQRSSVMAGGISTPNNSQPVSEIKRLRLLQRGG